MSSTAARPADVPRPPIGEIGVVALAFVAVSVIYLAAYLPGKPNTAPAYVLLGLASTLLVACGLLVGSLERFSRSSFHLVAGWALLAYLVIGGMIEFVFLRNHTRGEELGLLTWGLVLFVLDVPLLLGFGVARYQQPD